MPNFRESRQNEEKSEKVKKITVIGASRKAAFAEDTGLGRN